MLKQEIKNMYNVAMGGFIDLIAENKRFFTQKEFEDNYAKITNLTHTKSKLDAIANKIEEEQKKNKQIK
jgi:disulfide oxidoreductase YuzD